MSYSVRAGGTTKAEVIAKLTVELAEIAKNVPAHAEDLTIVQTAAEGLIGLMPEPKNGSIEVTAVGSKWQNDDGLQQVSASLNVSHVTQG